MYADAGPAFYIEHLKRLRKNGIQPYFMLAHVHQLEIVERLIRQGVYMGPLNMAITAYGGGGCGRNPFDWMEFVRRTPQGAIATFWAPMRIAAVPSHWRSSWASTCGSATRTTSGTASGSA